MSISDRDKRLLIIFVGILIFALVYYFPIRGYIDDTDKVKIENLSLSTRLSVLESKVEREAEIKAETAGFKAKIINLVAKFPSFLQTENEVMDLVELEKDLKIEIPSITVNEPVEVQTSTTNEALPENTQPENQGGTSDEVAVTPVPPVAPRYKLFSLSTNVNYKGGYKNLKDFLDRLVNSSDKFMIHIIWKAATDLMRRL